jgi:hypothetical protein
MNRPEMPDPPPGMELQAGMMLQLENGQVGAVKIDFSAIKMEYAI